MTGGGPGVSLSYDPLMRLHQVAGTATTQFGWDDTDLIAEYDGAGALLRRYVMDPGDPAGQPVVWYEGSGTSDRRFLSADERGSIISVTDGTGALLGVNRYDEFGQPQSTNPSTGSGGPFGRFGYTGQAWLPELGVWYYRARMYEPELGRFLQLDPIGYADSPNLYQYVLNDPVDLGDPLGLAGACDIQRVSSCADIVVMGGFGGSSGAGGGGGGGSGGSPGWGIVNQAGDPIDRGWWKKREPILIETPKPTDPPVIVSAKHPRIVRPPPAPMVMPTLTIAAAPLQKQDFCGSEGSEWVPEGDWGEACRIHDECYGTPGANKQICDVDLGRNVTAACFEDTMLPPVCAAVGALYWFGVTVGGVGPYNRGQHHGESRGW